MLYLFVPKHHLHPRWDLLQLRKEQKVCWLLHTHIIGYYWCTL